MSVDRSGQQETDQSGQKDWKEPRDAWTESILALAKRNEREQRLRRTTQRSNSSEDG
jgi:hypothetical protein